jgi:hypothetical protein
VLAAPLLRALPKGATMIATDVTGTFFVPCEWGTKKPLVTYTERPFEADDVRSVTVRLAPTVAAVVDNREIPDICLQHMMAVMLIDKTASFTAAHDVVSNVIVPAAVTRMAEGIDTSAYPPMGPELVAPVVGYLAHESCSVTGEMFVALAGRVATAAEKRVGSGR